jgi:hypothetical protein
MHRRDPTYLRPDGAGGGQSEEHNNDRRMSYPNPSQHSGMQPPMSPGSLTQTKDQNDLSANGSNTSVNIGYNPVPMNNPIPNPANPSVNSNPSLNRSNTFENDQVYTEDMGRNSDQAMHLGRKRNRSSGAPSQGPGEGYMSQPRAKLAVPRSQTQSTPPNHNSSPSQNQSPSEGMHAKQGFPTGPYYPAGKSAQQFAVSGYGPVPGSGNQIPPNYNMSYPAQQQAIIQIRLYPIPIHMCKTATIILYLP